MRFIVLGGTGYVGGRLVQHLEKQGHEVLIGTRALSKLPSWVNQARAFQIDQLKPDYLASLLSSSDIVVHLAGPDQQTAREHPLESISSNNELCWTLISSILKCSIRPALIYLSTFHVYGANAKGTISEATVPYPIHPYALIRCYSEAMIRMFKHKEGLNALCLRMSNGFGAPLDTKISQWSLVFNDLCRQAVLNQKIILQSAGTQKRNFISLSDCVRAIEFLAENQKCWPQDGLINLGSSMMFSIQEAAQIVADRCEIVLGYRPVIITPEIDSTVKGEIFSYSIARLEAMGFKWDNNLEQEVDDTLNLCRSLL